MNKKVGLQNELTALCNEWLTKIRMSFQYTNNYSYTSISLIQTDKLNLNDKKDINILERQKGFVESFVTHDNYYKASETLKLDFVRFLLRSDHPKEALSFLSHIRPAFYEMDKFLKNIVSELKPYKEETYLSYFTKQSVLNQKDMDGTWVEIIKNCRTEGGKEKILNAILQTNVYNADNKAMEVRCYKLFKPLFKNIDKLNHLFTTIEFGEISDLIKPQEKKELLQFKIDKMKLESFGLVGLDGVANYTYKYTQHLRGMLDKIKGYAGISDFKVEILNSSANHTEEIILSVIGKDLDVDFWNSFFNVSHTYIKKLEEVRGVDYVDLFSKIVSEIEVRALGVSVISPSKGNKLRM